MLQTIKEYIRDLPNGEFGQYFQGYVKECQDKIISNDVSFAELSFDYRHDTLHMFSEINDLTEELKKL